MSTAGDIIWSVEQIRWRWL